MSGDPGALSGVAWMDLELELGPLGLELQGQPATLPTRPFGDAVRPTPAWWQ
jgi:hypothetical protein